MYIGTSTVGNKKKKKKTTLFICFLHSCAQASYPPLNTSGLPLGYFILQDCLNITMYDLTHTNTCIITIIADIVMHIWLHIIHTHNPPQYKIQIAPPPPPPLLVMYVRGCNASVKNEFSVCHIRCTNGHDVYPPTYYSTSHYNIYTIRSYLCHIIYEVICFLIYEGNAIGILIVTLCGTAAVSLQQLR